VTVRSWKHCPRCATQLTLLDDSDDVHVQCAACGFVQYDNPIPTCVVVILDDADRVLLVRRGHDPRKGHWDAVGGFLNLGETAEESAHREIREELDVDLVDLAPIGTFINEYLPGRQTLGCSYTARLAPGSTITLSDENTEYAWFGLDALPDDMAFLDGVNAIEAVRNGRPLFHVTSRTEYDPTTPGHRPPGFADEGFVHLCTERQVAGVLERYYAGREDLLLLELDQAQLDGELKWEPGAGSDPGPFPHLYAPLPRAAVRRITSV
jgi:NAD+ diphosphatase